MVSNFYLLFTITLLLFVTAVHGLSIFDDSNLFPTNLYMKMKEKRVGKVGSRSFRSRAANFIFPPLAFISPSGRSYEANGQLQLSDRQSFGRRHHWDTYFGRRR